MNISQDETSEKVLWVGPRDLVSAMTQAAVESRWNSLTTDTPLTALRQLRGDHEIDMVVLLPGPNLEPYLEACRSIKFDGRSNLVSVVCLLSEAHAGRVADLLDCGADDCVLPGTGVREIGLRLRNALRVKHATDSMEHAGAMILSLARAIEGKDEYTCGHVERVGSYSVEIGRRLGLSQAHLDALRTGGVVHDIGKVGIPDHILNKPGKLTEEEMTLMKRHPVIGYDILKPMRTFANVLPIVRWHHEKPNGKGYPDGLKDGEIPVLPRIAAIADWFDALSTDRPYRKAYSVAESVKIMRQAAGTGDLDGPMVDIMADIVSGHETGVGALAGGAAVAGLAAV